MRFIETKPKILIKKGSVFSVTNASIFVPKIAHLFLAAWAVESECRAGTYLKRELFQKSSCVKGHEEATVARTKVNLCQAPIV